MKRWSVVVLVFVSGFLVKANAQEFSYTPSHNDSVMSQFNYALDSLRIEYYTYFRMWDDIYAPAPRRRNDPNYYKLTLPTTFYCSASRQVFSIDWQVPTSIYTPSDTIEMYYDVLQPKEDLYRLPDLQTIKKKDQWINRHLMRFYVEHPDMVKRNELWYANVKALAEEHRSPTQREEKINAYVPIVEEKKQVENDKERVVYRPNFWKFSGNANAQFSQNSFSDNWYTGGENTYSALSGFTFLAKFDDKQRVEWENKLELKLGFITAPSDTVHSYKTNSDLFRFSTKVGVKAIKNVYYTVSASAETQFFANYQTNSDRMVSNFLSPLKVDVAVGLDYKLSNKKYNMSLIASPGALNFVYLNNDELVSPTSFGVEAGHTHAILWGSKVEYNLTWTITKTLSYVTKMDYFTTYHRAQANWENTFNLTVSKYFSTKLFVHVRFDDGVSRSDPSKSFFQIKELFSFGLNYSW